jgi:hypothetical protein
MRSTKNNTRKYFLLEFRRALALYGTVFAGTILGSIAILYLYNSVKTQHISINIFAAVLAILAVLFLAAIVHYFFARGLSQRKKYKGIELILGKVQYNAILWAVLSVVLFYEFAKEGLVQIIRTILSFH